MSAFEHWTSFEAQNKQIHISASQPVDTSAVEASHDRIAEIRAEEALDAENTSDNILSSVDDAENTQSWSVESHKDGGIDFSDNAVSIPDQISNVETKIAALEEKGDLSRADKRELYGLKKELVALENQKQDRNEDAIERKTETVNNLAEINRFLGWDIARKYPDIGIMLSGADAILAKIQTGDNLTEAEDNVLQQATEDILDYLGQPQNRVVLASISRDLMKSGEYENFKTFLINQDPSFRPILEEIEKPQSPPEMTAAAWLPWAATHWNPRDGFSAELSEDTNVTVQDIDWKLSRSISIEGTYSPISLETDVVVVDISAEQEEYHEVLKEAWTAKQLLENAQEVLDQNPDAPLDQIKASLQDVLWSQFSELGIAALSSREAISQRLQVQIGIFALQLKSAKKIYDRVLQTAIQRTRELYEKGDEKVEQTLRRIKNLWLDRWNLDALIREMKAGQLMPDLWVPFDLENIDLAKQNFWESESLTDTFDVFNENLTRFANKGLTGNPEGLDGEGRLIGFNLQTAMLNPNSQTKTDSEIMHLMESQGIMRAGVFNINQVKVNLRRPIEE